MEKRGQVAIFVIIALVIVGVIIAIFSYPKLASLVAPSEINPTQYLGDCISPDIKSSVELLAKQGGDENPVGYINYLGTNVKYLCYVSGYYQRCMIQQPLLMTHFSNELSRILTPKLEGCARNLAAEYQRRGYSVEMGKINSSVSLAPGKIVVLFMTPMTVSNEQGARTFDRFEAKIESQIYDLLAIATSIVDYEATYGDSETALYMQYYPDLKIEKIKLEDGVKIYKLSNVVTKERFTFATRSLVWPAGYGL
jgi:hypothetical protein